MPPPRPEDRARETIDRQLTAAGWLVQDSKAMNLYAGRGVAVREYPLTWGPADYLLFVDRQAVGVIEAKKGGVTLTGVELQTEKYSEGVPTGVPAAMKPLPYLYQSTGVETRFTNRMDPESRSRRVFNFHRPGTLAEWLAAEPVWLPAGHRLNNCPAGFRLKLQQLPELPTDGLWPAQATAVRNLEKSLAEDRPRALIQMATGSGKTFTAITSVYRLIKHGGARRVLFLVDRGNLGRQAEKEFQQYVTPDDGRKFTELYNVQRLISNRIDPVAKVCICTIQRLYSMLKGEELEEAVEETSVGGLEMKSAPTSIIEPHRSHMLALGGLTVKVPRSAALTKKLWSHLAADARRAGEESRARFLDACGALDVFLHDKDPTVHLDVLARRRVLKSLSSSEQTIFISLLTAMQDAEGELRSRHRPEPPRKLQPSGSRKRGR